ncbi:ABC transporter permease [Thermodesulfobacteriota bacterium]
MRSFLYMADFAVRGLLRQKTKNLSITALFALIVFLFSGIHFMSDALYQETLRALEYQPSIIVQSIKAGRQVPVRTAAIQQISKILGVADVRGRVWGYYFDPYTGANYTIVGDPGDLVDRWELVLKTRENDTGGKTLEGPEPGEAIIGEGVLRVRHLKIGGRLNFQDHAARPVSFTTRAVFSSEVSLWTHDLIVVSEGDARRLFGLEEEDAWDLAVYVPNDLEVPKVGEKITRMFPGARVIATKQLKRTYGSSYGFRSGILLASTVICLLAFLILAYDRMARLSREEQREIAILKAIGWETRDVIRVNMLQSLILSLTGFLVGAVLSYFHVFYGGAPLLRIVFAGWSVLYPPHPLPPMLDLSKLLGLMFLTVVPYIAVGIIPVWRASVKDPEEVFRS